MLQFLNFRNPVLVTDVIYIKEFGNGIMFEVGAWNTMIMGIWILLAIVIVLIIFLIYRVYTRYMDSDDLDYLENKYQTGEQISPPKKSEFIEKITVL